jgi:hypothetical protein
LDVERLVLKHEAVDPTRALFRIERYPPATLVREDVAEHITKGKFTAVTFEEVDWAS